MNKPRFKIIALPFLWVKRSVVSSGIAIVLFASLAHAAPPIVGKVISIGGQSIAQQSQKAPRNLRIKDKIYFQDMLTTIEDSTLHISMSDGAKIILRPNTKLYIQEYDDRQALLKILQGGIRVVTGKIAKKNPDLYQVITPEGTITILGLGADYSVRACREDCDQENQNMTGPRMETDLSVVAKVVALKGSIIAGKNYKRLLDVGYPVYSTEHLVSAKNSYAQLQFKDGSSVTIQADSSFDIVDYKYNVTGYENTSVFKLLAGGLRFVSGLISKIDRTAFKLKTSVVTIGIRGTDFSVNCVGNCNTNGIVTHVHSGSISQQNESGIYIAKAGTYSVINSQNSAPAISVKPPMIFENNIAPPPSKITIDRESLFTTRVEYIKPGTHVGVHKGYVKLFDAQGFYVTVAENFSAFSSQSGYVVNTGNMNSFQLLDSIATMSSGSIMSSGFSLTPTGTGINTIVFGGSAGSATDAIAGTNAATTVVIQEQTIASPYR